MSALPVHRLRAALPFGLNRVFFLVILLCIQCVVAHASLSSNDLPTFAIPTVDFARLDLDTNVLLPAFQDHGVVAVQNIPAFVKMRQDFLMQAVTCLTQVHKNKSSSMASEHRKLDEQVLYTFATSWGHGFQELVRQRELCPTFPDDYEAFSRLVTSVVGHVVHALRTVANTSSYATDSNKSDLGHLEPAIPPHAPAIRDRRLLMHTSNGLMVAIATPEHFRVDENGNVSHLDLPRAELPVVLQTQEGKRVRPILNPNELVLLLGEGGAESQGVGFGLPPNMHPAVYGLRFSPGLVKVGDSSHVRAWFGRSVVFSGTFASNESTPTTTKTALRRANPDDQQRSSVSTATMNVQARRRDSVITVIRYPITNNYETKKDVDANLNATTESSASDIQANFGNNSSGSEDDGAGSDNGSIQGYVIPAADTNDTNATTSILQPEGALNHLKSADNGRASMRVAPTALTLLVAAYAGWLV